MGLDIVELSYAVEARYKISLPIEKFFRVRTVADVAAVAIASMRVGERDVCPTARAFYEFRRLAFAAGMGAPLRIRPSTPLADVFPEDTAYKWHALRQQDARIPAPVRMRRTHWGVRLGMYLAAIGIGAAVLVVAVNVHVGLGLAMGLLGVFGLGWAQFVIERVARVDFPPDLRTVGDLARSIATYTIPEAESGARLIAEARVLEEVRAEVARIACMPIDQVRPESRLIEDLGMG